MLYQRMCRCQVSCRHPSGPSHDDVCQDKGINLGGHENAQLLVFMDGYWTGAYSGLGNPGSEKNPERG